MEYDATWDALLRPYLGGPIEPEHLAGNPDGLCAELSRLVYIAFPPHQPDLPKALSRLGLSDQAFFEDAPRNTQAFAALDREKTAYVVFRGTESRKPKDLATDAMFWRRRWSRGRKVHRGFAKAYDSQNPVRAHNAEGQPIAALDQRGMGMRTALNLWLAANPCQRLVTTGHSLGGALATLFASDHDRAELITFGSPKVGNGAFAALFDPPGRTVRRYRDCSDVVTRVPPDLIGYRHTKGLIYFDQHGKRHDPAPDAEAMRADVLSAAAKYLARYQPNGDNAAVRELADHAPINYISAVLDKRAPD